MARVGPLAEDPEDDAQPAPERAVLDGEDVSRAIIEMWKQRKDDRGSLAHSFARLAELMTETSQ